MKSINKLTLFVLTSLILITSAYAADDSPLFQAVRRRDKAEVEVLLAKGADVNAKDKNGETPLHRAAYLGTRDIVKLLLAKGADVNSKDKYGNTPLHKVVTGSAKDDQIIIKSWLDNGMDPAEFVGRDKDIAEWLLARGADANAKNKDGRTPLHLAIGSGMTSVAKLLLAKGADVNAKDKDGSTPLLFTFPTGGSPNERKGNVELLLANGADVNVRDNHGRTLLEITTSMGEPGIVELLQEHIVIEQTKSSPPRAALVQLTAQLKDRPDLKRTRRLIIKLASGLKPAPVIPEEARKHFVEGTAIVKAAKNPAQQAMAAQSFGEALKIAPWWGDAYYNLGVALELAEKYDEAEKAFNFYLLTNPSATEKREVQDRIYALTAKRKLLGAK